MKYLLIVIAGILAIGCGGKAKIQEDDIYSRHLQRSVKLTVYNTPLPDDKESWNLLILNDGQEFENLRIKQLTDSLWNIGRIQPLIIIAVHAGEREKEFGVADRPDYLERGKKAGDYDEFIHNELLPFVRERASVRKFHSLGIAGFSLGGLSAFDIAWNHADKFTRVGIFSGAFWWRDKDATDPGYRDDKNRIIHAKILSSRKRPDIRFFFSAGELEEKNDRDKDSIIDVIDDTNDLITLLIEKRRIPASDILFRKLPNGVHGNESWSQVFPEFLIWAYKK